MMSKGLIRDIVLYMYLSLGSRNDGQLSYVCALYGMCVDREDSYGAFPFHDLSSTVDRCITWPSLCHPLSLHFLAWSRCTKVCHIPHLLHTTSPERPHKGQRPPAPHPLQCWRGSHGNSHHTGQHARQNGSWRKWCQRVRFCVQHETEARPHGPDTGMYVSP